MRDAGLRIKLSSKFQQALVKTIVELLGKTLYSLTMRVFIQELTDRYRGTVRETKQNAASLCYKQTRA